MQTLLDHLMGVHDYLSGKYLETNKTLEKLTNTEEKEFGETDKEYDDLDEKEWLYASTLDHLEYVIRVIEKETE